MDLIREDLRHDDLAEVVRGFTAQKLYDLVESLQPCVDEGVRSLPSLDPYGQVAVTGVVRAYMTALGQLSKLYQLSQAPAFQEPVLPASQVLEMVEAKVAEAVEAAVQEAVEATREDQLEARRLSAQEAKLKVMGGMRAIRARAS